MSYTIVVGTVGGGLWVGYNGGENGAKSKDQWTQKPTFAH